MHVGEYVKQLLADVAHDKVTQSVSISTTAHDNLAELAARCGLSRTRLASLLLDAAIKDAKAEADDHDAAAVTPA